MKIMEDTCTHIAIQKQLKHSNSGICKQIYTPQQYNQNKSTKRYTSRRKPRYNQNYRSQSYVQKPSTSRKTYTIRSSNSRKPTLNPDKHVRNFRENKTYKQTLRCYACNQPGHFSRDCPNIVNLYTKEAELIKSCHMNLLPIDEDISTDSEILSVVSIT